MRFGATKNSTMFATPWPIDTPMIDRVRSNTQPYSRPTAKTNTTSM